MRLVSLEFLRVAGIDYSRARRPVGAAAGSRLFSPCLRDGLGRVDSERDLGGWGASAERWGTVPSDPAGLERDFVLPLDGRITSQVLYADGSFFASTSSGEVASFTSSGVVRWKDDLGQLTNRCAQLDGYGVTGTGVIDPTTSTLYVADAFGRLHALALSNGAERPGWPVRVFTDDRRELVWGALTEADGAIYVPTASYCDSPMVGGIFRVI